MLSQHDQSQQQANNAGQLAVGDEVSTLFLVGDTLQWFSGQITRVHPGDTYDVRYSDDGEYVKVPRSKLQQIPRSLPLPTLPSQVASAVVGLPPQQVQMQHQQQPSQQLPGMQEIQSAQSAPRLLSSHSSHAPSMRTLSPHASATRTLPPAITPQEDLLMKVWTAMISGLQGQQAGVSRSLHEQHQQQMLQHMSLGQELTPAQQRHARVLVMGRPKRQVKRKRVESKHAIGSIDSPTNSSTLYGSGSGVDSPSSQGQLRAAFEAFADRETHLLSHEALVVLLNRHRPTELSHGSYVTDCESLDRFPKEIFAPQHGQADVENVQRPGNDSKGGPAISFEQFEKFYQVCKRCTDAQNKKWQNRSSSLNSNANSAKWGSGSGLSRDEKKHGAEGDSDTEHQQNSKEGETEKQKAGLVGNTTAVPHVIVRRIPTVFAGNKIKACSHFRWIWCSGIPGNKKCQGSNRHDKCPKYLARSTLWKHRVPPRGQAWPAATST